MGLAAATMVLLDAGNVLSSVCTKPLTRSQLPLSIQGPRTIPSRPHSSVRQRRLRNWPKGALQTRPSGHPDHKRVLQLIDGEYRACVRRGTCPRRRCALSFECMALGALGTRPEFSDCPSPMCQLLAIAESASPEPKGGPPSPQSSKLRQKDI